jgi:endo-1,4-beta-xylanase
MAHEFGTLAALAGALAAVGLGAFAAAQEAAAPLRDLARKRGILIGPAVGGRRLNAEPDYAAVVAREFNVITPENDFKWAPLSKARGKYDFTAADALVDFAAKHGIAVHGHTLVWHNQNPKWLEEGDFSRDEMLAILREHITTVVGRWRGRVTIWDVVNEAFDGGKLRESLWLKRVGPDYIEQAFRIAHEIDPKTKLVYNDYGAENLNAKSDAIYAHLKELLAKGVPVHGVGFQAHIQPGDVDIAGFRKNLRRFAELGLEVYVTELDVRLKDPPTDADLKRQADAYGALLDACLGEPACKGFQTWGFTDKHSWVPGHFKGMGSALIFDADYRPKPAYHALHDRLSQTTDAK